MNTRRLHLTVIWSKRAHLLRDGDHHDQPKWTAYMDNGEMFVFQAWNDTQGTFVRRLRDAGFRVRVLHRPRS